MLVQSLHTCIIPDHRSSDVRVRSDDSKGAVTARGKRQGRTAVFKKNNSLSSSFECQALVRMGADMMGAQVTEGLL